MTQAVADSMRNTIKKEIVKLPQSYQQLFKRMYAHPKNTRNLPDVDSSILLIVDAMDDKKLDRAMLQIQQSLDDLESQE